MYDKLLKEFIKKNFSKIENAIVFFKGFPSRFYNDLFQSGYESISAKQFLNSKGYIDIKSLSEYDAKVYIANILNKLSRENIIWGFYEELTRLSIILRSLNLFFNKKIVVVNNNLFEGYYPIDLQLSEEEYELLKALQESEEDSADTIYNKDLETYFLYYADIKKYNDTFFASYINKHTDEDIEEINFYDAMDFVYTNEITDRDTISIYDNNYLIIVNKVQNGEKFESIKVLLEEDYDKNKISPFVTLCNKLNQKISIIKRNKFFNIEEYANKYLYILKRYWGEDANFRELKFYKNPDKSLEIETISQGNIISDIIEQCEKALNNDNSFSDIFITAPTGAGKSLLFQIPAIYLAKEKNAVTIIVSPLISLMNDQIIKLKKDNKINFAEAINSGITYDEKEKIIERLKNGEISIIYLSPEFLLSTSIDSLIGNRKLGLFVIDEAHLVTTWGRDFRVDYWYLGYYLNNLREVLKFKFPVVCLTATAVYQGPDDMISETIDSLNLRNRKLYLGQVKRENIEFEVNYYKNKEIKNGQERFKLDKAKERICQFIEKKEKSLMYCPYTSQVERIYNEVDSKYKHLVGKYYGDLDKDLKDDNQLYFKEGFKKIMLCTKAFGMGVDVKDIVNVYHYAPTGNLADYVQEIGRAARDLKNAKGKAIIDFTPQDLRYIRILYGLSAIRQYQLKEMMRKLYIMYSEKKRRNMLISPEIFSYIFVNEHNLENRVKSALLLISKDLFNRYKYPVLFVRPRGLFTHNYINVPYKIEKQFVEMYESYISKIEVNNIRTEPSTSRYAGDVIIYDSGNVYEIDLAKLWEERYSNKTFAEFKKEFFEGKLFDFAEKISPRLRFRIIFNDNFDKVVEQMETIMDKLINIFNVLKNRQSSKFFLREEFEELCENEFKDYRISHHVFNLILQMFTLDEEDKIDAFTYNINYYKFIQQKIDQRDFERKYRIVGNSYINLKSQIIRGLIEMRPDIKSNAKIYERYIFADHKTDSKKNNPIFIISSLLEFFRLASFEIYGGRNVELFVRLNDPYRLEFLINNKRYINGLLKDIESRRNKSQEILAKFFSKQIDNQTRWDIIELYFLGKMDEVVSLLNSFPDCL